MNKEDFNPYSQWETLPAELREQLETNALYDKVLKVIVLGGGCLSIKEIMVGLYKTFGIIVSKPSACGAVFSLKRKGSVVSTGIKGEWELIKPTSEE